jgi:hypothetical protein
VTEKQATRLCVMNRGVQGGVSPLLIVSPAERREEDLTDLVLVIQVHSTLSQQLYDIILSP